MNPFSVVFFLLVFVVADNCYATLRVSPQQLKEPLSRSNYLILDARSVEAYMAGHIPGAISFPVNLTYHDKQTNGKLVKPKQMQKYLRARGIDINSNVVIYDNGDLVDAARLFWALEVYGLRQPKVLDHGYDYWINNNLLISLDEPSIQVSQYVAQVNNNRLASKFSTQLAMLNSKKIIIDARAEPAYQGETSVAKRFGHIPTAINIPASHNFAMSNGVASLQPLDELKKLYTNIPRDKKVVIYCAIGRISSANYLALRELGYDVANYDASWKEWGNDFKLPIEK